MKKAFVFVVSIVCLWLIAPLTSLAVEYQHQKENLIRLHVVGSSNDARDQQIKLLVRDAVIQSVQEGLVQCADTEEAKAYLQEKLDVIELAANETLKELGCPDTAVVTLCKEEFPARNYDTFSLPSGVYTSLRICIGEAEGKNWWCVVFPSFCFSASSDGFVNTAAGAGFSQPLRETLAEGEGYEIGFFFLDCIGKLENFFHFD